MRIFYSLLVVLLSACIGTVIGEILRTVTPGLHSTWLFTPFHPLRLSIGNADILLASLRANVDLRWNLLTVAGAFAGVVWCLQRVR